MGIFKRMSDVFKANINDLISKAENPEKMLNQMIIDMNEHLIEAKKGVASSIADEKRLERQVIENQDKSKDWEGKAMLAVKAGNDDLAKQALVRKQEYDGYIVQLKPQWEQQHAACVKLKEYSNALDAYAKAGEIDPNFADAFFNMGYVYAVRKEYANAEKMYSKVVNLSPMYVDEALFNLGMVQEKQGKRKESLQNIEKALSINPGNGPARKALARLKGK